MKWVWRILIVLLCLGIVVGGVIIFSGYQVYQDALKTVSLSDKITKIQENEDYIKLDKLPVDYKNAVISVEDRRFYNHGAIDVIAIGRAIYTNIVNWKLLEGGSTITQQVGENLYFISSDENQIVRKIAEFFMACELEKQYEKDEILELYMNTIYFGDGYYGIQEACKGYFKKDAKDMTLYESTMMAGIPNAPSVYAPTANLNLTLSRQRKVISTMVENKYLTQEQADNLIAQQPKVSNNKTK